MLRKWQSECVNAAMESYTTGQRHFLCLATPGAGKTIMAAEVAANLFDRNMIDGVLCFSPSITIADGIKKTFSHRLQCPFTGGMGDKGVSLTYQSLSSLSDEFWASLQTLRLLVVFDEIHHCAGGEKPNAWGNALISRLQTLAAFTLALTGTPWRSNATQIAFAAYSVEGNIHCDYTYGLAEAVADQVCRRPNVVLVDNEELVASNYDGSRDTYPSVSEYLSGSGEPYGSLLNSESVLLHVLKLACQKLSDVRLSIPDAAGLVVASTVQHAEQIAAMLRANFKQASVVVTYRHDNANGIIEAFKTAKQPWIVSVGMISEGTDIPRLQVCCHLSRVKTELHFRQVLGRIQRKRGEQDNDAWLYTIAEPNLVSYAEQLTLDVPESTLAVHSVKGNPRLQSAGNQSTEIINNPNQAISRHCKEVLFESPSHDDIGWHGYQSRELLVLGDFKQRVLSHFT
ncbi:DEAD/DEAH box helicase family protein [Grimontia sp. SpTr1]|uniref:DEAD/DEAH box helicase n=1 Tax=Grimontia sp. SpTr1 TaxID=2995319 RepID=UPI00248BC523|nr:DEAD/DEAH box helicase family protein [Grimontia sp. SpTr1]